MPADDVTSGGTPPMISGQTIIGMKGHKRQQRRQQQEQLSLSLFPPRSNYSTSHSSLCHRDTPCTSWLRQHILFPAAPQRCLTPSTKCIGVGRASAARQDHNDVRVTESQHVCCDTVAWHLHTHTQRLHPPLLCPPSAGVATHTGSSKIISPSMIQNQH
ncbi:hypothetical protein TcCL_Unassigned03255 [Trypanosoma cruzi]|nr:hypothetical protein TcCL_Unassigned03255 [Trypanosoma cruzi]